MLQEDIEASFPSSVIISTSRLTKAFGNLVAVNDLHLEVMRGDVFGFLGPNGSGKTTTIKMLLGLVRPTAGEAFVLGRPAFDDEASIEIRRRVGYVSEDKRLYPFMTGRQIIDFTRPLFPRWSSQRELELVSQFKLPRDQK